MSWLRQLFTRRQIYRDLSEEIQQHLAEKVEALMAGGMSRKDAEYAARREFGNVARIEESGHEPWMWPRAESILADIRFAFRKLRHSPGFALTAILTLAIGIGANVVTFSILNGILLRPLDVPHPENLLQIGRNESYPDSRDYQYRNQSFSEILAYRIENIGIGIDKSVYPSWGNASSSNYFDVLDLQPALGRFFHASDEHGLGSAPYIVLSYDFWQRHLAASPDATGKTVLLNQHPFTVIGVAPENFHGTDYFFWPDYWIPAVNAQQVTGWDDFDWRGHREFTVLGRLKCSAAAGDAEHGSHCAAIGEAVSGRRGTHAHRAQTRARWRQRRPHEESGPRHDASGGARPARRLRQSRRHLRGACGNRSNELAIRLAIGSSRWAVARQLLMEAVLVSFIGGIVGTFFARLLLGTLSHWRPGDIPTHYLIAPDLHVYLVAIALSIASGIVFGILPAWQVRNTDVMQAIKSNYVAAGSFRRFAMRDGLLLIQVVVCTLLVTSALVAVRGMVQRLRAPLGIAPGGVTLAQVDLKVAGVPDAQSRIVQRRLLDTAAAIPGVTAAATSDYVPFLGASGWAVYSWDTTQLVPAHAAFRAINYSTSPGYFQVAGTHLLYGRDFTSDDKLGAPTVAIVNETFARLLFGTSHAVGKRFKLFDPVRLEIVGVVEDGKYTDPGEPPIPAIFIAYAQGIGPYVVSGPVTVLVRSPLPQYQITRALHNALSQVVTTAPINVLSWSDAIDRSMMPARTAAVVLGVMGLMAALLAATGIFGMASYSVSKRMREQGIRIALGAQRYQVIRSTLSRPIFILLGGSCIGLIGGLLVARLLAHLISFPSTSDPMVLSYVVLTMMLLGLASTWIPARRALAIDPARLLRDS